MEPIDLYLHRVRSRLRLDPQTEGRILQELQGFFEEQVAELRSAGMPVQESVREAIRFSGKPQSLGRLFHEVYSQGSWRDALLAVLPHLLVGALFLTHRWPNPLALLTLFAVVLCVSLRAWARGRPNWAYPWIGYSFAPLIATVFYSMDFLGRRPSMLPAQVLLFVALYALFIGLVVFSVVRVVKRDWLLVSFMLFPVPVLGVWISEIARIGVRFNSADPAAFAWDRTMSAAFLLLGCCSALFVRIRRRLVRILLLTGTCLGAAILVGRGLGMSSALLPLHWVVALPVCTLLAPALLEWILGHGESARSASSGQPQAR